MSLGLGGVLYLLQNPPVLPAAPGARIRHLPSYEMPPSFLRHTPGLEGLAAVQMFQRFTHCCSVFRSLGRLGLSEGWLAVTVPSAGRLLPWPCPF
jgi:hypothetical protein